MLIIIILMRANCLLINTVVIDKTISVIRWTRVAIESSAYCSNNCRNDTVNTPKAAAIIPLTLNPEIVKNILDNESAT
jgi:hypothetical protein